MMKELTYYELLSPAPIEIFEVGHLSPPTLRRIAEIGYLNYYEYLNLLCIDLDKYLELTKTKQIYENLPEHIHTKVSVFELLIKDTSIREMMSNLLSFFICEEVQFNESIQSYHIKNQGQIIGCINGTNYDFIRNFMLQMNYINNQKKSITSCKSKKARQILEKIQKAKENVNTQGSNNMSLPNIISALASQHNSLNILNIWDLTVYQLYDQFFRQNYKNQIDIHAMNYANWGGEFDQTDWFKSLTMNE